MGDRQLYGDSAIEMLRDLKRQEREIPPFKVVLCHNAIGICSAVGGIDVFVCLCDDNAPTARLVDGDQGRNQ
jgi:hypothetical protein